MPLMVAVCAGLRFDPWLASADALACAGPSCPGNPGCPRASASASGAAPMPYLIKFDPLNVSPPPLDAVFVPVSVKPDHSSPWENDGAAAVSPAPPAGPKAVSIAES